MKLHRTILLISSILSLLLILSVHFIVNIIPPFSSLGTLGGYVPWIERLDHFAKTNAGGILFLLSILLMLAMIVMIRRAYSGRLNRVVRVAAPVVVALFLYILLEAHPDVYFHEHDYIGFLKIIFLGLPMCFIANFIGYVTTGLILLFVIVFVYYPIGILIDKSLLYITSKMPKHNQG